ncbi:MAG: septum formation initiator family protein [Firmicutes bacterium]|jgi:cell division protein DivIC|nr:septum formation initiator family protein [Bacillota bacterium]NLO66612.1 septum formation initiator family protein [Bacillota bacterium]
MALSAKQRRLRAILLLLVILWVGYHFARSITDNQRLRREIADLEAHLRVLQLRGEELEKEIALWRTPEYVERVAREELGLVKPGEVVYQLSAPLEGEVERDVAKRSGE